MRFFKFLLLILIVAACNSITEDIVEQYDNGQTKTVKYYKGEKTKANLIRELQFYPDGTPAYEKRFKNQKPHGQWMFWYKNGKLWSEGEYDQGLRIGVSKVYHENGQLFFYGIYKEGKKHGTWLFYNEKGELETQQDFDMGKPLNTEADTLQPNKK